MLATNTKNTDSSITNEPDPKVIEAFYSLYHSKEFKIFEIKIKELINYYPFSINLMNIYTLFLNEQKRYSEAVLLLERIIKIQPSNYRSIFDLGICCSITGNVEKALKCFQNLLQKPIRFIFGRSPVSSAELPLTALSDACALSADLNPPACGLRPSRAFSSTRS